MKINLERLKRNTINVGEIGKVGEGITRTSFSKEYYEARDAFKELMLEQGLEVTIDKVGNIFGRREGTSKLPSIMTGSHLDTVKNGGLFDGNLGVMSALECIAVLNENNIKTNHPIEIVAFVAEENSAMGGTFGSRVFMGKQDIKGKDVPTQLATYGLTIQDVEDSFRDPTSIKAFLELHIEQGGNLENKSIPIGIVNGIAGITRYFINVKGEANHAGTTPMGLRKDALTMAAKVILEIDKISKGMGDPFVSTIGKIKAYPGDVNVIPGEIEMTLEIRDIDQGRINEFLGKVRKYAETISDYEVKIDHLIEEKPSVRTSESVIKIMEDVCLENNINYQVMASGAGHDAKAIAYYVPTGMIFVPSVGGRSHIPEEFTKWGDAAIGAQVLLETILKIDKAVL